MKGDQVACMRVDGRLAVRIIFCGKRSEAGLGVVVSTVYTGDGSSAEAATYRHLDWG